MPMTMDTRTQIRAWLEAEAAGRTEEADQRFRAVSREVARPHLPPGFAGAVMARLGAPPVLRDAYSMWWVRAALGASIALVGGAAALVPWHVWLEVLLASLESAALWTGRLIVGVQAWAAGAFTLWGGLAQAGAVVGRQLLGPVPLAVLVLNLAVALCALGALRRLMALQEN